MKTSIMPALENLGDALFKLEKVIDGYIVSNQENIAQTEIDFAADDQSNLDRKIATKLDDTIERLETLLNEGEE